MHKPVLPETVLFYLNLKPGQIVVDGTVGSGGHAELILEQIGREGFLVGLDQDPDALKRASKRLNRYEDRVTLTHSNFNMIADVLDRLNFKEVDAVLLDIGVSSEQLEEPSRGFSFAQDGVLDMRMDPTSNGQTAREIVNRFSAFELERTFRNYGEERFAKRIAKKIILVRKKKPIERTGELKALVESCVPGGFLSKRIHPATRVFQALRIAVNRELETLEEALPAAFSRLKIGGRCAVIAFHSLEDRIVKRYFQSLSRTGQGRLLTKKPVQANPAEIEANPRSRSAKLRVVERIR